MVDALINQFAPCLKIYIILKIVSGVVGAVMAIVIFINMNKHMRG